MTTTINRNPITIKGYEGLVNSTLRGTGAMVFGGIFAGIGLFYTWVAWGDTPPSIPRPNVSDNLFGAIALGIFALPGLFLVSLGLRDKYARFRIAGMREQFADEPWRWDFPSVGHEITDLGLRQAIKGLFSAVLGAVVIGVMAAVVWTIDAPWFAKLGMSLFIGLLLISFGTVLYRIFIQLVHGRSRLRLPGYPLRLGETVELELIPRKPIDDLDGLQCTLRCVQEDIETTVRTTGGSRTKTSRVVARALYRAEQTLPAETLAGERTIRITFELPDDPQLQTQMSEVPPRYWDLTCTGARRGADYHKQFLLPVY